MRRKLRPGSWEVIAERRVRVTEGAAESRGARRADAIAMERIQLKLWQLGYMGIEGICDVGMWC